jgi:SM-20-related protein
LTDPTTRSAAAATALGRCPHVVFEDVLGPERAAALLDHAEAHAAHFTAGRAYNRTTGEAQVDPSRRDCLVLGDMGPFGAPLKERFGELARIAVAELRIGEADLEPVELEITSYGDGGHIHTHIDTRESREAVRVLSCVYYFSDTPRRFGGGELRLYGFPSRSGELEAVVDVPPATDTLVAFPSWMRHEVLPVRLGGEHDFRARRFTVNCWLHRAAR